MLVDTSVWIDHLRQGNARLISHLEDGEVECHSFVIGELACGRLARRSEVLALLGALPRTVEATHDEVLTFIDAHRLSGKGLGWIDIHLLAAAMLSGTTLWTADRSLAAAAGSLDLKA